MATIKSFTSLEQSKVLAEILPLESADMYYPYFGDNKWGETARFGEALEYSAKKDITCWSLAALFSVLPIDWWDYNKHYFLEISKMGDISKPNEVRYYRFREQSDGADFGRITHISFQSGNLVDACYEMILKLHELKML